jgi:chromosome segregation ATPase
MMFGKVDKVVKENKEISKLRSLTDELNGQITRLQGELERVRKEKYKLVEDIEELKLRKRLENEEIQHMIKINEERLAQKLETEKLRLEKEHQAKITELERKTMDTINKSLSEYHGKMESRFSDELKNLKEVYSLLMQRLPNVNFEITKTIEDKRGRR